MSLSQIAEFGFRFPKLGARVDLAREKGSEVGGNLGRQAAYLFARIFYVSFDTTIMLGL